ncbi:uncharacterized protein LOC114533214 isoform X1 [Dendronephthya gigantea]|uniref:uncharacterized protein LOC114533214 isoform X1 n=2 Tax=Dendronephthya gigantea TaxID=151771 RepID=UPI001069B27A|nr:uncharacterized protein LOC114533214 isoform X1 [Dendronephthya gigantea]
MNYISYKNNAFFYISKFLLLVLGMNNAISDYACIYCLVHKNERWDTSKVEDYYHNSKNTRTLSSNRTMACKSSSNYGCIRKPLLSIPIQNVRIDELHLLLRITDILERNIINDAIERDVEENLNRAPSDRENKHLQNVVEAINNCGVSFSVWKKKNADGTDSGMHDWTSMVGNEKKKVLAKLPAQFPNILEPNHCDTITEIWQEFRELYGILSSWKPSEADIDGFFGKAKNWVELFLSLGGKVMGYEKARITPYIHILLYHVPRFIKDEKSLKSFTGQGIEKINDVVRAIYHNKSNRHDACKEAILALRRIDNLQNFERIPHQYKKQDNTYWSNEIFEQRRKKPRLCVDPREDENDQDQLTPQDVDSMSLCEVKEKLKEMKIKTKLRKLDKLKELLKSTILGAACT